MRGTPGLQDLLSAWGGPRKSFERGKTAGQAHRSRLPGLPAVKSANTLRNVSFSLAAYLTYPTAVITALAAGGEINPPAVLSYAALHSALCIPFAVYLISLRLLRPSAEGWSVIDVSAVAIYSLAASAAVAGLLCFTFGAGVRAATWSLYAYFWMMYGLSWIVGPIVGTVASSFLASRVRRRSASAQQAVDNRAVQQGRLREGR